MLLEECLPLCIVHTDLTTIVARSYTTFFGWQLIQ